MTPDDFQKYAPIIGFLGGGAVGSIITHFFTRNREASNRRREFREFLGQWLNEIHRLEPYDDSGTYKVYLDGEKRFAGFIAKLKGDFFWGRKFTRLSGELMGLRFRIFMRNEGTYISQEEDCRLVVSDPIEALLAWV